MTYRLRKAVAIAAAVVLTTALPGVAAAADAKSTASPQTDEVPTDDVFGLGTIVVTATPVSDTPGSTDVLDASQMQTLNRTRVSTALETVPGINLMPGNRGGSRNETGIFLRGFDQSRVPIFSRWNTRLRAL